MQIRSRQGRGKISWHQCHCSIAFLCIVTCFYRTLLITQSLNVTIYTCILRDDAGMYSEVTLKHNQKSFLLTIFPLVTPSLNWRVINSAATTIKLTSVRNSSRSDKYESFNLLNQHFWCIYSCRTHIQSLKKHRAMNWKIICHCSFLLLTVNEQNISA